MCAHQVCSYVHPVSTGDPTNEPANRQRPPDHAPCRLYEIRVEGQLGSRWATWFDGMSLTAEDDGTTVIRGPVVDQAALHGLLHTLRDLGVTLLSLTPLAPEGTVESPDQSHHQSDHQSEHRTHHHSSGATT